MPYSILVVDDSAVMRAMILRTLRLSGLRIARTAEAGNGAEALERLAADPYDLALVDLNMPVMNGEELIDRIRDHPVTARLPILVVSTESSETRIAAIRERGVSFVHKPFTPATLADTILRLTGTHDVEYAPAAALVGGGDDF
jgi:two-component system chemotaxis response regulator CheY